jgi:hypothetical protein
MISVDIHGISTSLPDPLELANGEKVTTAGQWQQARRPEILELFRREVYGRAPLERPSDLKFEVTSITPDALNGLATKKIVEISFSGTGTKQNEKAVITLALFIPNAATKPCGAFLLPDHRSSETNPEEFVDFPYWPVSQIVERGYATASFKSANLDPDRYDEFKNGVHGLFDGEGPRADDAWGTISAWAWGASRVMDYFETDSDIDTKRVAVLGHSRGGKTALWAGAQDERFALVISNNSGCTGAAIARNTTGETVERINSVFPHWFCQNYKTYNNRVDELPVDQHQLAALIAPRLLYIASASDDAWADPESEFRSGVLAGTVYELFGLNGLSTNEFPAPETPLHSGYVGFHLRTGGHGLNNYDWGQFMDFADNHWNR